MISQNNLLILGAGQYGVMAAEIADAMGVFGRIAFLLHSSMIRTKLRRRPCKKVILNEVKDPVKFH